MIVAAIIFTTIYLVIGANIATTIVNVQERDVLAIIFFWPLVGLLFGLAGLTRLLKTALKEIIN